MADSTVLQWGLTSILVCGMMITVLIRTFTSVRNHLMAYLVISVKAARHLTNVQRNKKKSIVPTLGTTASNKKIKQEDKTIKTEFFAKAVHQQINAGKKERILWNAAKMAFAIRISPVIGVRVTYHLTTVLRTKQE